MNLIVATEFLKDTKICIDTAGGGREAVDLALKNKYDVILMDQRMPEMDGEEAFRIIRSHKEGPNINTPVICLTADAVVGARERYLSKGFDDYLTKPIDSTYLEMMLKKYIPSDKIEVVTEEETAPRRTRAPKATPTRTADFDPNDFVVSVQNATSEAELSALRNALKTEEKAGRVTSDVAEQLSRVIENRYVDFENSAPQAAGTVSASDQEANVYDLIKEVKSQASEEGLRRVVGKASAWRSSGDITDDGFKRVVEVAESAEEKSTRELSNL
jgi:CheY-like chemotaxis protein